MVLYDLGKVTGNDGAKGDTGNGIQSIAKTGTSGLVDTYTITFTDRTTTTFTVTNGSSASVDIVTSWNSTTSNTKVPSEKLTKDTIDGKASSNHTHGNLTNDGKIGTTSGKPLITGTGGAVQAGSFGTTSGTFAQGNHTHSGYVSGTKVVSWQSTPTDSNIPSEKLVKDTIDDLIGVAIQYIQQ